MNAEGSFRGSQGDTGDLNLPRDRPRRGTAGSRVPGRLREDGSQQFIIWDVLPEITQSVSFSSTDPSVKPAEGGDVCAQMLQRRLDLLRHKYDDSSPTDFQTLLLLMSQFPGEQDVNTLLMQPLTAKS